MVSMNAPLRSIQAHRTAARRGRFPARTPYPVKVGWAATAAAGAAAAGAVVVVSGSVLLGAVVAGSVE